MSYFGGSFLPSANKLSGSVLSSRLQDPHKISWPRHHVFDPLKPRCSNQNKPEWNTGDTYEWYKGQPTKKFTHLQYQKEREAPFFHEFIAVGLDDDTVCRFDRRGDPSTRVNSFTPDGMTAEDTAHVIQRHENHYAHLETTSDVLMRIEFPGSSLDLLDILIICYVIQGNDKSRALTVFCVKNHALRGEFEANEGARKLDEYVYGMISAHCKRMGRYGVRLRPMKIVELIEQIDAERLVLGDYIGSASEDYEDERWWNNFGF
ncbi:hypothetical protein FRC07_008230 [Ceratobasidium sp. 392]|nr:hypothetical protein FRC07_008230 [Ceratobasidium sp. 392]